MKSFAGVFTFILLLILINNAPGQDKLKSTANGIKYKIYTPQSGKKIELNNIITFNLIEKTEKDSVLFSTYARNNPLKAQIIPSQNIIDFMDIFVLLYENDSVLIHIPTDSIYKNHEFDRPEYLSKGSVLIFLVKIENVQTVEEAVAEEEKALEAERSMLAKYLFDNNLKPLFTASGLLYIIKKRTKASRPEPGDTVLINYTAGTIGGNVFDSSIKAEALKAGLKQPGRDYRPISVIVAGSGIITAWDEGLLLMNEGSLATFIIPSHIAFGAMGYAGLIEPYTTLIVDVELLKIKKDADKKDEVIKGQRSKIYNLPDYRPKPVINSLASFILLLNNEKKKEYSSGRNYTISSYPPFKMHFFDIINKLILQ